MDWLIQHVSVDSGDRRIAVDPYNSCPAGSRERRLGLNDPMPYLRHDQRGKNGDHPDGYNRHDARPMRACVMRPASRQRRLLARLGESEFRLSEV